MNSVLPHPQDESRDELDNLLRRTLKAVVGSQEPPERVWKRIKLALEKKDTPPRRLRIPWLSLAVQPALALLLVVFALIGLQTLAIPDYSSHELSSPVATKYVPVHIEQRSSPASVNAAAEDEDLYLLKSQSRRAAQAQAGLKKPVPEMSSETRPLPQSKISPLAHPTPERQLVRGGPSEI